MDEKQLPEDATRTAVKAALWSLLEAATGYREMDSAKATKRAQ